MSKRWVSEETLLMESGEELRIRRASDGAYVQWLCGEAARFDWAKLAEAIAYIEMFPSDVWVNQQSSGGTGFATLLEGDRLWIAPRGQGAEIVSWADLKAALLDAQAAAEERAAADKAGA